MKRRITVLLLLAVGACGQDQAAAPDMATAPDMDTLARDYLLLELSMGRHDSGHVDAYFGPQEIAESAEAAQLPLDDIAAKSRHLQRQLAKIGEIVSDPVEKLRVRGFADRLVALDTRIALKKGHTLSFDEESRKLFGTAAPDYGAEHFEAILDEIDALLDGDGTLADRVVEFRNRFVVPPERLTDVFDAAIAECRRRTRLHMVLPEHESFSIEYVNNKPWSGYNWYQGDSQSLIQINTDLPIFISRAVDLGCHEGYPGHHTFNALLEKNLVQEKGWLEFSLYPLFSPQSLIAEGSGNYGIDLAFPGDERIEFEKTVLFPLAGLDASEADRYYELLQLIDQLDYAGNEAARDYLNGNMSREAAIQWLVDYTLTSPDRARQRTDFFDTYRSYVINYNLGRDLVRDYVERGTSDPAERWRRFENLLSSPMTATDLN